MVFDLLGADRLERADADPAPAWAHWLDKLGAPLGLSIDETRQLGALIRQIHAETGAQVLVIDHDVDLIREVCAETLVLDFGKRIAFGPTDAVLNDASVKAAYLGTEEV